MLLIHKDDQQATLYTCPITQVPIYNILCVHGAGFTGTCWTAFVESLMKLIPVNVLVVELRGHGKSGGKCSQLSLDQLIKDLISFQDAFPDQGLPSFLVGHSLGGSLVARLHWPSCIGICLLDITEESALFSVSKMDLYLQNRPSSFASVEEAAKWFFKKSHPNPLQLQCIGDQLRQLPNLTYAWNIPLKESKQYWTEWFTGMDDAFLSAPVDIRMLILAGNNEQLDGPLMKGQMQGKFQLHILPGSSHAIMLDAPDTLAQLIVSNLKRFAALRNKATI